MNGIINVVRFVAYSVGGLAVRKAWNWLIEDVDPIPGSKSLIMNIIIQKVNTYD